ncbi:hypothetical protein [Caldalkalibacillus mannanilyticus]|uniref:hypothetical protein n=1 Tax=Caldalkalibacillus mannanilyticus TaxID=1418 RepID=UPI000468EB80|nr:hypothetical protein [Caldalkalibacillus mannanilyticus]
MNRYTGQSYNRELYEEFAIKLELPYIPEWKNVMQSDRLWSSTPYNEAMLKLFRFISPNE